MAEFRNFIQLLDNYDPLCRMVAPIAVLVILLLPVLTSDKFTSQWKTNLLVGAAIFAGIAYTIYAFHYLALSAPYDHLEPTMVTVARLAAAGAPVYHSVDAASRYSMVYGPNAYLAPLLAMKVFGPAASSVKLMSALFAVGSLVLVWDSLRRSSQDAFSKAAGILYFCGATLLFRQVLVWMRSDSQLLFWMSLGVWGPTRRGNGLAFAIVGFALGGCFGTKVHGLFYFAPVIALLVKRGTPTRWLVLWSTALISTAAPFLFPCVSLTGYVVWLALALRHGVGAIALLNLVTMAGFLLLPVLLAVLSRISGWSDAGRSDFFRLNRGAIILGGIGFLVVLVVGAKKGAGETHLFPFIPMGSWLLAWALATDARNSASGGGFRVAILPFAGAAIVVCLPLLASVRYWWWEANDHSPTPESDIRKYLGEHPHDTVEMGCGGFASYPLTFARIELPPVKTFTFDAGALMDMQESGLEIPKATLAAFKQGVVSRISPPASSTRRLLRAIPMMYFTSC